MKFRTLFPFITSLLLAQPIFAQNDQDATFLAAREAFRSGDLKKLERLAATLADYELAPYLESWQLRMKLEQGDNPALSAFFERQDKTVAADRLRADWIRLLAKKGEWPRVVSEGSKLVTPEQDVTCLVQQGKLNQDDKTIKAAALDEAQKYWLTLLEPPEPCQPVLEALIWEKRVLADDVWLRTRRQVEANRLSWAKQTLFYLPPSQTPDARQADAALGNSMSWLVKLPASGAGNRAGRELIALALSRIAANDPRIAAQELEKWQDKLQDSERQWAWGQIGWQAAKRHMPDANLWFEKAGKAPQSDDVAQWRVRAALRALDWGRVRSTIELLPTTLQTLPEWTYWLGRAYKAGGRTTDAEHLFEKIAGQANFYGNLADEELGRPINPPPKPRPLNGEEKTAARDNPVLKRALAFFRIDLRTEAVREWNAAIKGMSDRELLAAAELAKENQLYDRAINTADKTRSEHDYQLRYLAPFGDQVRPAAKKQALDDAWVYGLMRQESRFIISARSNVGASGLMQLMPATAKWVAKKIGLQDFQPGRVTDTETNVLLGTSYMRMVMENLDNHPVLASAAYNAGPGRAKKWRADVPLEGAIYAETIPFPETRDYVKKVMSNAVFYSTLFNNRPDSLKARLGTVASRSNDVSKDADLP